MYSHGPRKLRTELPSLLTLSVIHRKQNMYNTNLNPQIACHTGHSNSHFPTTLPPITLSKSFEPFNMGCTSALGVARSPQAS